MKAAFNTEQLGGTPKEGVAVDLVNLLIKDYNYTIPQAIDILYLSETYEKIYNPDSGLYFQSAIYLYSFLKNAIENGKIG